MADKFEKSTSNKAFSGYGEYMEYLFACVNMALDEQLERMKLFFATGKGGYKNVLYPDLEVASEVCVQSIREFQYKEEDKEQEEKEDEGEIEGLSEDLFALFGEFVQENRAEEKENGEDALRTAAGRMEYIASRAEKTVEQGISMPFYELCRKLNMDTFTIFCFASGILSSTQTDYAGVFQVINENASLSAPTIESAAKLYFGKDFSISASYGEMSACLEQLMPVLNLHIQGNMPFSTVVSPDKRMIDYLFGKNPMRLDENYIRFFKMLTEDNKLDPIMANEGILDAMKISYDEGVRIFSYFGDEGSGRKFFVKHFCLEKGFHAISVNCKKLFIYDFQYVDKALWAVTRECILTNACLVLDDISFREDEAEKVYGYMDKPVYSLFILSFSSCC